MSLRAGQAKEQSERELRELQKGQAFPEIVVQCMQILTNALAASELCEHMPSEKDPHVRWYSKAPGLGSVDHGAGGGPSAGEESEPYMFAMTTEHLVAQLSPEDAKAATGATSGDDERAAVMSKARQFKKRRRERWVCVDLRVRGNEGAGGNVRLPLPLPSALLSSSPLCSPLLFPLSSSLLFPALLSNNDITTI